MSWGTPRTPVVVRPRADTRQATVLQLLPLLPIVLTAASVQFTGAWTLSALGGSIIVTSLVQGLVARSDRQMLDARGFGGLAPASLALVSALLYLVIRARRCEGHDRSAGDPIPWTVVTTIAAVVIAVIATFVQAGITGAMGAGDGGGIDPSVLVGGTSLLG
jgi:drug/metabolite transporter superfamily protein YnfA